jgi:hypothetical protein
LLNELAGDLARMIRDNHDSALTTMSAAACSFVPNLDGSHDQQGLLRCVDGGLCPTILWIMVYGLGVAAGK